VSKRVAFIVKKIYIFFVRKSSCTGLFAFNWKPPAVHSMERQAWRFYLCPFSVQGFPVSWKSPYLWLSDIKRHLYEGL